MEFITAYISLKSMSHIVWGLFCFKVALTVLIPLIWKNALSWDAHSFKSSRSVNPRARFGLMIEFCRQICLKERW